MCNMHIFRSPITAVFTFSATINQAVFVKTTKLSHGFRASVYVTTRMRTYAFWRLSDYCIFIDRSLETRVLSSSANGELILNMSPAYYCLPFWPPNYVSRTNPNNDNGTESYKVNCV